MRALVGGVGVCYGLVSSRYVVVDPRTGEILDADIGFEGTVTRLRRV